MIPALDFLREHQVLSPLDVHFATHLSRIGRDETAEVRLAVALVSHRVSEAHVCLDLDEIAGRHPQTAEGAATLEGFRWPELPNWLRALERSPLVGGSPPTPLVLEGTRLYLRRYHDYEIDLAETLRSRAEAPADRVDRRLLRDGLRRLFPDSPRKPDWQRLAAALAVLRRLTVVSGGPGTGKTWAVARILALLVEQAVDRDERPPRIHLLAPTGKAAARLKEAIRENRAGLAVSEKIRALIPEDATTIHRALGAGHGGTFRHDGASPLVTDAVIVDEASMVDLSLMSRLLAAVPNEARVILLGDRDQLASVEAGSVLADICGREAAAAVSSFSKATAAALREVTGEDPPEASEPEAPALRDCIVQLQDSRRFEERPGIGALAAAINAGDGKSVFSILRSGDRNEVFALAPGRTLSTSLAPLVATGYAPFLEAVDPAGSLAAFGRFRVLCAHRRGPTGVESVNGLIERALAAGGRLSPNVPQYDHRPLLVTRNDPATRLFNGDTGIIVTDPEGSRKAAFPSIEGDEASIRFLSLARLPAHETAFALTVHKSQGSEFDHVVLVLPEKPSPVLTRELLYTAVTRARSRVTIIAAPEVLEHAVRASTRRSSGLRDRLWSPVGIPAGPSL